MGRIPAVNMAGTLRPCSPPPDGRNRNTDPGRTAHAAYDVPLDAAGKAECPALRHADDQPWRKSLIVRVAVVSRRPATLAQKALDETPASASRQGRRVSQVTLSPHFSQRSATSEKAPPLSGNRWLPRTFPRLLGAAWLPSHRSPTRPALGSGGNQVDVTTGRAKDR